jgi:hypothetical protein
MGLWGVGKRLLRCCRLWQRVSGNMGDPIYRLVANMRRLCVKESMGCLFIRFSTLMAAQIFNIASYSRTTMSLTTFTENSILRYDPETKCAAVYDIIDRVTGCGASQTSENWKRMLEVHRTLRKCVNLKFEGIEPSFMVV